MKKILSLILILTLSLGLVACSSNEAATEEAPVNLGDLAVSIINTAYTEDIGAIFYAIHPAVLDVMLSSTEMTTEAFDELVAELNASMQEEMAALAAVGGKLEVVFVSERELSIEDLDMSVYEQLGLSVTSVKVVTVAATLSTPDEDALDEEIDLTFVEIDGTWYLDYSAMEGL